MNPTTGTDRCLKPIMAGGVVVVRPGARGLEVLVVHRKQWNDWSIPKGKNRLGECTPAAAVREVREETGVQVRLGVPLDQTGYETVKGPKVVQYWSGTILSSIPRVPDDEVDVVSWIPVRAALARLTFAHDRVVLEQCLDQPPTTPLVLVRHAKAMQRKSWVGNDQARPTDALGRRQALQLVPLLSAFGIGQVISSSASRCVQTVLPYATRQDLGVIRLGALTEEESEKHPKDVSRLMKAIRDDVGRLGQPTVVCGHRPVLPRMLWVVGLPDHPFGTSECTIAHITGDGETHAVERHRPVV